MKERGGISCRVGECIYRDSESVSAGNSETPPLQEIIVMSAKPHDESEDCNKVWIIVSSIFEYNAIAFRVRGECKTKAKAIADFIDKNKGRRLLVVLEMDLP